MIVHYFYGYGCTEERKNDIPCIGCLVRSMCLKKIDHDDALKVYLVWVKSPCKDLNDIATFRAPTKYNRLGE